MRNKTGGSRQMNTERKGEADEDTAPAKRKITAKKVWRALIVLLLAAILFVGGLLTGYFSVNRSVRTVNWLYQTVTTQYYKEISDEEFYSALVDGTLFDSSGKGLLDSYSEYYSATAYATVSQQQAGSYTGMGAVLTYDGRNIKLYRVSGNSPAEKSGLVAGMYITGYGETDETEDRTEAESSNDVTKFIYAQPEGETFYLWASEEEGGEEKAYAVYRAAYQQNYVFYADSETGYRFVGDSALTPEAYTTAYPDLPSDTAIIRLDSFAGDAAEQFKSALGILKERGRKKLILDLRNNGGGQMTVLDQIAAYLCKNAPTGAFPVAVACYRSGKREEFAANKNYYSEYMEGVSVSVLANCNTASASEALIGAMVDYGTVEMKDIYLAKIGTAEVKSYGKGIMQTTFLNITTGEAVKLTTATVHWPVSGTTIHETGITADMGATSAECEGVVDLQDKMLRNVLRDHF
jgi:carboxyl-terminal processing protease